MRGLTTKQGMNRQVNGNSRPKSRWQRYFHVMDGEWYIESRSGQYGPFRNPRDAEQFANALLEEPVTKSH